MRLPKRGERGFTLIELLIVVAILGVLAAVVIPNVTQFFGKGEAEARRTELHNVQLAVATMMIDNGISAIPTPLYVPGQAVDGATNQMALNAPTVAAYGFPDYTTAAGGKKKLGSENYTQDGYVLFDHQIGWADPAEGDGIINDVKLVNYLNMKQTTYFYTCAADGTVRQWASDNTSATGIEYTY